MKKSNPPNLITVAIITTITIIFWIFFEVYKILTGEVDVNVSQELLKLVNPTLDQAVLSSLKGKTRFEESQVTHFTVGSQGDTQIINEEPAEITPTPTVSLESVTPNEQQATPSSDLEQ
ncbi:hypothetical protein JXA63_04620 [Candidatus Woesebacteria bacterium]|nr:hypothetical protein [Candidatus Woesebacteria bacterium]